MVLPGCRALSFQVEPQGGARLLGACPVMPFFWITRMVSDLYLALTSFCSVVTSCACSGAAARAATTAAAMRPRFRLRIIQQSPCVTVSRIVPQNAALRNEILMGRPAVLAVLESRRVIHRVLTQIWRCSLKRRSVGSRGAACRRLPASVKRCELSSNDRTASCRRLRWLRLELPSRSDRLARRIFQCPPERSDRAGPFLPGWLSRWPSRPEPRACRRFLASWPFRRGRRQSARGNDCAFPGGR